jgi:hypothetical protein
MRQCSPLTESARWIETQGLRARAIVYKYRYCPNCRREWPAKHSSCPTCIRWLGDRPSERTEWQLLPVHSEPSAVTGYRLIGASAVVLRIISDRPANDTLDTIAGALKDVLTVAGRSTCAIPEQGWLVWTTDGLRHAFLQGLEIERRLVAILRKLETTLHGTGRFRWGIWIDQYIVPFGRNGAPAISPLTAKAVFNFEPDDLLLCSEALYEANRPWEHFVCVPRRLTAGEDRGYRLLSHKRPSALDHAKAADVSPFVGRDEELAFLVACYWQSQAMHTRAALIAAAGSGKTRLIKEWRRQHPKLNVLMANFSLFGGDLVSFVSQLAALPPDRLTADSLLSSVLSTVEAEHVDVLVMDDLHWADSESIAFISRLLNALSSKPILALLVARPSGRRVVDALTPLAVLELKPLPPPAAQDLAQRLIPSQHVAAIATQRSKGNPLFVEQLAAWAMETHYQGTGDAPENLHQVIAARIAHLSAARLDDIRQRLHWAWDRRAIEEQLDRLEDETGLWLDRLETGDYGDRVEVARHLMDLERVDFEIFMASTLAAKPRPRSSRLREAIERLLVGSADQILGDLNARLTRANDAERANIFEQARRAGDMVAARFNWRLAETFYELASTLGEPRQRHEIACRLADCRRRLPGAPIEMTEAAAAAQFDESPAVDALRLPEVWLHLGYRHRSAEYFQRAAEAAEVINNRAVAEWARKRARLLERG